MEPGWGFFLALPHLGIEYLLALKMKGRKYDGFRHELCCRTLEGYSSLRGDFWIGRYFSPAGFICPDVVLAWVIFSLAGFILAWMVF